jgi:hypothetical protein
MGREIESRQGIGRQQKIKIEKKTCNVYAFNRRSGTDVMIFFNIFAEKFGGKFVVFDSFD